MMHNSPGIFIVIEGADGSGKGTQFKLLKERLRAVGYDVAVFDFPRYDQPSSYFVQRYLNGAYGSAVAMSPYTSSMFYALDRFEAAPEIRKALIEGKIVLSNRYVGSNMAHQGSKINDLVEQRSFFIWEDNLEFELLGIPRPTINIFLRVPADVSYELIKRKSARTYTKNSHDEHEADKEHLQKSVATYDTLCQLFPKDFKAIDCTSNGELLNIPTINNLIWEEIKHLLPDKPPHPGQRVVVQLDEPKAEPEQKVPEPAVAAEQAAPVASLARPVKSDTGISIKLDNISLYAAAIMRTSPGISLSTGSPWEVSKGRRLYYVPEELSAKEADNFRQKIDKMAVQHKNLHRTLLNILGSKSFAAGGGELNAAGISKRAYEILRPTVPLAAQVSAEVAGLATAFENLIIKLLNSPGREIQQLGQALQDSCKKNYADEFKGSLALTMKPPKESRQLNRAVEMLAQERLPQFLPDSGEELKLIESRPRNELALLADIVYPYSELSREDIEREVERWSYEQKVDAMTAALHGGNASQLLDLVRYRWDVISDWPTLEKVLEAGVPHDLQLQPPSPRFGFGMPQAIEEAAMDDEYMENFDTSLGLFSELQLAEASHASPYATLLGHKVRWQAGTDLPHLLNFAVRNKGLKLAQTMLEKASEVHPLLIELAPRPVVEVKVQKPTAKPKEAKKAAVKKPAAKPAKKSPNKRRGGKPKKP